MKKPATIKEKIGKRLDQMAEEQRRGGLLRETALLKFRRVPNIRKLVQYFTDALLLRAPRDTRFPYDGRT